MQDKILETFTNYVRVNNLTAENCHEFIQTETYTTFFNDLTIDNLKEPNFTHDKCPATKGSLVYMPDAVRNKYVPHIDIININSFYFGALVRLDYNYDNYVEFIDELFKVRKDIKKRIYNGDIGDGLNAIQILIKVYLNLIYGMVDNAQSVLTSTHEAPREFIIEQTKFALLSVASFLTNKGVAIYNIETDEIHCASISLETYVELQEFYTVECDKYIDVSRCLLSKDEEGFTSAYYVAKKKYMIGDKSRVKGLADANNEEILKENKQYFGQNFPEIFPEYAL